jgi:hypothetical protein
VIRSPTAGLSVDPTDPRELVLALCRLLTPGAEWDAWSRQARTLYDHDFTAVHFQERLLAAISPLL